MSTPEWLLALLKNPAVTDVCLNGAHNAFFDQGQGMEPLLTSWTEEEMKSWVLTQLSAAGKSWDARHPFVDATLSLGPSPGHRLHITFPPLSKAGILVSLRRLPTPQPRSHLFHSGHWGTSPLYPLLQKAVAMGENLLIAGATGSGKTTLANDLLSGVCSSERILALEDTPELSPAHPHFISLVSRPPNADGHGEVTLRNLMKQALRMRPDRIILGECRGTEVLELLQALNTGHRGTIATIHANSARDALRRIELLCLLASHGNLPLSLVRELLASGVHLVAFVGRHPTSRERTISEVWRIAGKEGDTVLLRPEVPGLSPPLRSLSPETVKCF